MLRTIGVVNTGERGTIFSLTGLSLVGYSIEQALNQVIKDFRKMPMTRKILRSTKKTNGLIQNPELRQQRRQAVADAAFDLFIQEGFHRATTRDIACRAGISNGAVFSYFKDKEDLLFYVVSHEQERAETQLVAMLQDLLQEASQAGLDPELVFDRIFTAFLRAIDTLRRFILLAYQETKSLTPKARQALIDREKHIQAILSEAIQYGVDRGCFAPGDIELKAHNIIVLAHAWATRHWAFAEDMRSVEDYIAFLRPQVLAMLEHRPAVRVAKKRTPQTAANGRAAAED